MRGDILPLSRGFQGAEGENLEICPNRRGKRLRFSDKTQKSNIYKNHSNNRIVSLRYFCILLYVRCGDSLFPRSKMV